MTTTHKLRDIVIGAPRDQINPETRHHIALIAFSAWVGLGADGLSSAYYDPEEAYSRSARRLPVVQLLEFKSLVDDLLIYKVNGLHHIWTASWRIFDKYTRL